MYRFSCVFILFFLFSCQDKDVCDEVKSPKLIVVFKKQESPTENKIMSYIKVSRFNADTSAYEEIYTGEQVDSISLPLWVNQVSETKLRFYTNSNIASYDDVSLTYTPEVEYTSRGCGFKRLYKNITYNLTSSATSIQQINPQETEIIDESKTHLFINF